MRRRVWAKATEQASGIKWLTEMSSLHSEVTHLPPDPASSANLHPLTLATTEHWSRSRHLLTLMLYMLSHLIFAQALQYGVSLLQLQKLGTGEVQELAQGSKSLCS